MENLEFRAFMVQGFMHGGGDVKFSPWRKEFSEAQENLKKLVPVYGDCYSGVETREVE